MAFCNILSSGIVGLISFFTVPLFTRVMDQSVYGLTGIYSAWVSIFSIIVGLQVAGSIGSAHVKLEEDEQDSYQLSILALAFLSFIVMLVLVFVFLVPLASALEMPATLVVCSMVQSFGACVIGVFNKRYIFKKQAQSNLVLSVSVAFFSSLLAIGLVVFEPFGLESYLAWALGYTIPPMAIGIGMIIFLAYQAKAQIRLKYWGFCLCITLPVMLHALSGVILAQFGRIAIQHEFGDVLAAVYSIAITTSMVISVVYTAMNNAFVPFMYDDLRDESRPDRKIAHFKNYFILFTTIACIYMLLSPEIVKVLAPIEYWDAILVVPLLIIGEYFVFLYSFPVNYEFFAIKTATVGIGTAFAAIINAVLVIYTVPAYGMMGAAASTAIAYVFLFVFHFLIARYRLGDRNYPAWAFLVGAICILLFGGLLYLIVDLIILRWVIGIALGMILLLRLRKVRTIF